MNKQIRNTRDINDDIREFKDKIKENKKRLLFSLISEISLIISYFIFVIDKGTKFDHTLSIIILTFFVIVFISNMKQFYFNFTKLKSLNREYLIATETKEEKMKRERTEKLSRVLNPEKQE